MSVRVLMDRSPIVIFGTGGSGTRVVAAILKEAGCYMGGNLNRALDNLNFGFFLGGRVKWMEQYFPFEDEERVSQVETCLEIFRKVFFKMPLTIKERGIFLNICVQYLNGNNRKMFRRRPLGERIRRGSTLFKTVFFPLQETLNNFSSWGFKSPEAIYFVKPMMSFFPDIRIIHLVRDGRDMALSANDNPLLYRRLFNLEASEPVSMALNNWLAVNGWAKKACSRTLPGSQYMIIRYEDICEKTIEAVDRILEFAGLEPMDREMVYRIPSRNPSIGRWKENPEMFRQMDTTLLKEFGF